MRLIVRDFHSSDKPVVKVSATVLNSTSSLVKRWVNLCVVPLGVSMATVAVAASVSNVEYSSVGCDVFLSVVGRATSVVDARDVVWNAATKEKTRALARADCYAQYTPPTPTRLNCRVKSSLRRRAVCIDFATSSRRLPTYLVEKLKTEHVESSWVVSGGVYSPVGSRDPVSNSADNSSI